MIGKPFIIQKSTTVGRMILINKNCAYAGFKKIINIVNWEYPKLAKNLKNKIYNIVVYSNQNHQRALICYNFVIKFILCFGLNLQ